MNVRHATTRFCRIGLCVLALVLAAPGCKRANASQVVVTNTTGHTLREVTVEIPEADFEEMFGRRLEAGDSYPMFSKRRPRGQVLVSWIEPSGQSVSRQLTLDADDAHPVIVSIVIRDELSVALKQD